MSHSSHYSTLRTVLGLGVLAMALGVTGCASSPTPPPAAAAPPSEAFQRASTPGVTDTQAPEDGVVFVEKEQKAPASHDDAPATSLQADQSAQHPKH